jgi:hypothetical protein
MSAWIKEKFDKKNSVEHYGNRCSYGCDEYVKFPGHLIDMRIRKLSG